MSGWLTNGVPVATVATGLELISADTQNTQGQQQETYALSVANISGFADQSPFGVYTTDNGTTQTLTVAMVAPATYPPFVYHITTGGSTPTLTTPTAAAIIANLGVNFIVGSSYVVRLINTNSGTATLAAGTGVTITGTATSLTNTTRDWLVTFTAAGAITFQTIGTATIS